MRFLVDAQLPIALARLLSRNGHEAIHVYDLVLADPSDDHIWSYAAEQRMVIVSKDHDFVNLARQSRAGPSLVWVRLGNTRTRALCTLIELALPDIIDGLSRGERLVEIT